MGRMSFDKWNGLTGMGNVISIGNQGFDSIRENNYFFIDKSSLIKEWWDSGDVVTLIIRPRRFGKTLNMSMLNCFFSSKYAGRSDLFKGLSIWDDSSYRDIQGTYPVIYLSFADVKQTSYAEAVSKIKSIILEMYSQYERMIDKDALTDSQRQLLSTIKVGMDDIAAQNSLKILSSVLAETTGKKVIILLDEYDTPMQEAYLDGYWDEFTAFIRGFFNAAFKTNTYLERAMLTGVTRVSKESAFSDLNNLVVVTTTSDRYSTCFGFTQQEVYAALDSFNLGEQKDNVKKWYDGFTFGRRKDIYNPWSITNYLDKKRFQAYWAATSGNTLVNRLIRTASADIKEKMENQAKTAYGMANAKLATEQQKLQDILIRRAGYESKARELVSGNLNVLEIRECRQAIDVMKSKQRSQMMNVHAAERNVELARKQLNEAMVERKTHEKLKEKAFEEFKQELLHEESKEIDELVSYTYHDNGQRS